MPVVAAVSQGTLTPADQAWLSSLQHKLSTVPTVVSVRDLGRSADGQAEQLQVLSDVVKSNANAVTDLIDNLRTQIARAGPPAGMQVNLAGQVAIQVDQQKQSGSTGNSVQEVALIFILVLLLVVFRAAAGAAADPRPGRAGHPAAGPVIGEAAQAGLQVSSLTQILLLVLALGAGTDYGLFLVFRVREELRAGRAPHDAVRAALARVGESITFSAATVIAALLTLLLATFGLYSSLGAPLAIAHRARCCWPASPCCPRCWPSSAGPRSGRAGTGRGTGRPGWWGRDRRPHRRASGRDARPRGRRLRRAGHGGLGYTPAGFGGTPPRPGGSDSAAGNALLAAHFPAASTATRPPCAAGFRQPVWSDPAPGRRARAASSPRCRLFTGLTGPARRQRRHPDAGSAHGAARHARATRARCPPYRRPGAGVPPADLGRLPRGNASSSAPTGGPSSSRPG